MGCAGLVVEVCVSKMGLMVSVKRLDFLVINDEDVEEFVKMVLLDEASLVDRYWLTSFAVQKRRDSPEVLALILSTATQRTTQSCRHGIAEIKKYMLAVKTPGSAYWQSKSGTVLLGKEGRRPFH